MNAEDHDAPYVSHPNLTLQLTLRHRKRERAQATWALASPAGFLRKSLCLIDALKGATRESLVEAYGEGVTQAVCGAQADPMALAIAESIRRRIVLKAERRESEKNSEIFSLETPRIPKKFNIYV